MARRTRKLRSPRELLFDAGIRLAVFGLAFVAFPVLLKGNPIGSIVAGALIPIGAIALAAGVGALALAYLLQHRQTRPSPGQGRPAAQAAPPPERIEPTIDPAFSPPIRSPRWDTEVFAAIEWRRFEAVVEALFGQAGFETRSQTHGPDGGVDIWLYSRNAPGGPVSIVQCKHWQDRPVQAGHMREFLGTLIDKKVKRGTYATSSRFTADALALAKEHGINALDGDALLAQIARRTPQQQDALLAIAYEGEYWKPTCARCGKKMTERRSGKDGRPFWGCVGFPQCRASLPMRGAPLG